MNKEDIIRMAREAGVNLKDDPEKASGVGNAIVSYYDLERFSSLVAAAEREKVAQWMMAQGYATGHGDTMEDLLAEIEWQIEDRIKNIIRSKITYVMQDALV